jgi:hypothetical protein
MISGVHSRWTGSMTLDDFSRSRPGRIHGRAGRAIVTALIAGACLAVSACAAIGDLADSDSRAAEPRASATKKAAAERTTPAAPPEQVDTPQDGLSASSEEEAAELYMTALSSNSDLVMGEAAGRYAVKNSTAYYYMRHQKEVDWAELMEQSNPGEEYEAEAPEKLRPVGDGYELCHNDVPDACVRFDHFQFSDEKVVSFRTNDRTAGSRLRAHHFDEVEKYRIRLQYRSALMTSKGYLHIVVLVDGRKADVFLEDIDVEKATYRDAAGRTYKVADVVGSEVVPRGTASPVLFAFKNAKPGGTLTFDVNRPVLDENHFVAKLRVR